MSQKKMWTAVAALFAFAVTAGPLMAKGGSGGAKAKQPTVRPASVKPAKTAKAPSGGTMTSAKAAKASTPKVKAASSSGPKAKSSAPAPTSARTAKGSGNQASGTLTSANTVKKESGPSPLTSANKETDPFTSAKKEAGPSPFSSANGSDTNPQDTDPRPGGTLPPTGTLNKAQQLLMKNDNLRMKMQTRLGGLDPIAAASGFRNLGQFVAAVNVSVNQTVPFASLKKLMTGDSQMSLGQALQQLRGLDPATAATSANTAQAQADSIILATSRKTKDKS